MNPPAGLSATERRADTPDGLQRRARLVIDVTPYDEASEKAGKYKRVFITLEKIGRIQKENCDE